MLDISLEVMGKEDLVYRAVSIDRLPYILKNGCDVKPTNSVIYADDLEKAFEYGSNVLDNMINNSTGKVIMILSMSGMSRSYREMPVDADPILLEKLRNEYPTAITSSDGKRIWFSRLPQDNRNLASPYEREYGWYIAGDPWNVLAGIIVVGNGREIETRVIQAVVNSTSPQLK